MKTLGFLLFLVLPSVLHAADLKLRDGTTFRNAKVISRAGTTVDIFIAGFGVRTVNYSQLMPEDQAALEAKAKADAEAQAAKAKQQEANRAASEAQVAARMAGVKTYTLKTTKGKTYEAVTSWEWEKNDTGIKIHYPGGLAHLIVEELDPASMKLVNESKGK